MPSGITADIYEGKDLTLRGYLLRVGRSMGYAVTQRDDPTDAPLRRVEASDYHVRQLDKALARIAELHAMSAAERITAAQAAQDEAQARWEAQRVERSELGERYREMISRVREWQPEPIIAATKAYALKYLEESLEGDCRYSSPPPKRQTTGAWWREQLEAALKSATYHREENVKEITRAADRNAAIDALYASLPADA